MSNPVNCQACRLHIQRTNVVGGEGKFFEPKLFIVGEAPGREEDQSGRPFVGGAGRVLNALLANAGIARSDCYITNTVRCRPPNNRAPELDELIACQGNLRGEIDKIKPRIIVALGDTASTLLTGKAVGSWRGSIVDGIGPASGYKVLITYHPAFVMRLRTMFPVVQNDLAKATQPFTEVKEDYVVNPTYERLRSYFAEWSAADYEVAVDIETAGDEDDESKAALNPWGDTFDIIGISFTPYEGMAVHLSGEHFVMSWSIVDSFLRSHKKLIYQNNTFDRCAILVRRGYLTSISWDTLDGIHLINPALPKKLDFLRSIYTSMEPYKSVYKGETTYGPRGGQHKGKYLPGNLGTERLARLNCLDTDATWRIAQAQKTFVDSALMQDILEEDDIAIEMRVKGVLIDQLRTAEHYANLLPKLKGFEAKFDELYTCSISSPKQLNTLLYDYFKFPPYDDKGHSCQRTQASTNEKAIQGIANSLGLVYLNDDDGERFEGEASNKEILSDILEYRGLAKIASTYCEGVFRNLDRDGILHPQWTTSVTDTGRWSCRGTPVQGYPKEMRDTVVARPGKVFFGADFKGVQILGAAVLAEDWELCEKMQDPNYSLHNDVLEDIKPHYPSIKKIQAKTVVFGTFFGRTPRSIAMQFHVPVKTAELWQAVFYTSRPKLRELFEEKLPKFWEEHGYAVGVTGRKKYCEVVTEAKNHPVQNFESVIVKKALKKLKALGWTNVMMIHDQIVCEEDDLGQEANDAKYLEFKTVLETAAPEYYHRFPVEGGWGYRWSEV